MIGAMSTISSPGRAERSPSMTPAGTLESSTPMRLPGIPARRFEGRFDELATAMRGRVVSVIPARSDDFVDEGSVEKWAEHVVGDQGRPVRLENQQRSRLDRAEHERRRSERGEVDQMRGISDDQQVAFRGERAPESLATRFRSLGCQHGWISVGVARVRSWQLWTRSMARQSTHRWTRAEPPLASASTSGSLAMVTSPGKVVKSAPWAQPRRRASSGDRPESSP